MKRIIKIRTGELNRAIAVDSDNYFDAIVESFKSNPPECLLGQIVEVIDGEKEPCYCSTERILEKAGMVYEKRE